MIGFRQRNRRSDLYSRHTFERADTPNTLSNRSPSEHRDELGMKMCDGICIPLCLVAKMRKNKDGSKRWTKFFYGRKNHNQIQLLTLYMQTIR